MNFFRRLAQKTISSASKQRIRGQHSMLANISLPYLGLTGRVENLSPYRGNLDEVNKTKSLLIRDRSKTIKKYGAQLIGPEREHK